MNLTNSYTQDNKLFVGITCYNKEKYIGKCLDSLPSQYHYRIVDDASRDNSKSIINKYNIQKTHLEYNIGASGSRNLLIDLCEHEYIMFLDGDDYFIPHDDINSILRGDDIYVFPYWVYIEKWDKTFLVKTDTDYNRQMSSVIIKRNILDKYKFNNMLKNLEDFELIYRLSKKYKFTYIDFPYYVYNKNCDGKRLKNSKPLKSKIEKKHKYLK